MIRTDQRESRQYTWREGLTVWDVVRDYMADLKKSGHAYVVVTVNGLEAKELMAPVRPGDFVALTPEHGFEPISAAIWVALWNAGMYAGINAVSAVLATAVIVGGGMLVSNLFSLGGTSAKSSITDSPTYGFNAVNATTGGNPVAVVYGNVRTTPQIINSYRRVGTDYNMWVYVLLGLGAGETNHTPTAADIYLGDEPLANYTDYYFNITNGGVNPAPTEEAALADKFSSIYHDRAFDRQMKYAALVLSPVAAEGTATFADQPAVDDTITIGTDTWTFKVARTTDLEVAIGDTLNDTLDNLAAAINSDSIIATAAHAFSSDDVVVTAATAGASGNATVFTAAFATPANVTLDGDGTLGGTTPGLDATDPETVFHLDTKGQVDQVMLMITFPYGKFQMDGDGNFIDFPVTVAYGYRESGTTGAISWSSQTLTGKGTQAIRKELWLTFPTRGKYEIYLQRTTADDPDDESKQRSSSYLTSLTEILGIFQTYPGIQCAVVGVKASENLSGQLPAIRVVQNRTSITVPDWSGTGTMTVDPTNHAWALYDALTNPYSGLKRSPGSIIQSRWEEWEDWLDGMVAGNRRARFNMVFDAPGNFADNCLTHIEETGRCKVLRCGDYWSVAIDKPKLIPSYLFCRGNILQGSWSWEGYEDSEKVDAVQVSYYDKDRAWVEKSVLAKASWYETLVKPPMVAELRLLSCNNKDQATREAILRMQKTEYITRHGKLSALFRAAGLEMLDRVDIVHATIPFGFSGCLSRDHDSASTIYLDQTINLDSASYGGKAVLIVIGHLGVRYEFDITDPWDTDTQYVSIDGEFTGKQFDVFAIGRPSDDRLAYQITTKKLNATRDLTFEVVEYNEDMFYHTDFGSGTVAI